MKNSLDQFGFLIISNDTGISSSVFDMIQHIMIEKKN